MTMRIKWDARLEILADAMLSEWIETSRSSHAPFGKVCVVVNDSATESWLKHYFLLVKQVPQVLLNLEFVRLQQFVNDWLQAQVHGIAPRERQPGLHPYSQEVMSWRIYQVLVQTETSGDFPELKEYVGDNEAKKAQRRFALAEQLSQLYDDYLNSRFQMLRNWETGEFGNTVKIPAWQIDLYRRLVAGNPNTYASDYACALQPGSNATEAIRHEFPKYLAVHVFDIPFMPEPTLRLLEKISEAMPLTFWNFNPLGDWLGETPSQQEAQRKLRQQLKKSVREQRDMLAAGQGPSSLESAFANFYDSPEERLLGILGPGARGLLGALCDDNYGDIEVLDHKPPFANLKELDSQPPISIHVCHSPRRELEILRDGLHNFFETHPEAQPQDVLVLCADWDNYAPIIDSVFTTDQKAEGYLPLTVAGGLTVNTPLCQSFLQLLEFRRNRFEVSAVFKLLSMPAIREKFGLNESSVEDLRSLVKTANIHWGYDAQDVTQILGQAPEESPQYTWRRGLDRLITEMLHGLPDTFYSLLDLPEPLGTIRPCGHVEGDRAEAVASLWQLVEALANIRRKLAPGQPRTAEELSNILLNDVLDTFYTVNDQTLKALNKIREAIRDVVANISLAGLADEMLDAEPFLAALTSHLGTLQPAMRTSANAVLFAPLNVSTATPRKLVWICGLNNGAFPRLGPKPAFDILGNNPSLFDTSLRERDAFALLKAVLGARAQLVFSYIGKDVHSNESIPPSVLLTGLTDYFAKAELSCRVYNHPLHAYSRRYFLPRDHAEAEALPPSYSPHDCRLAQALEAPSQDRLPITAFPLVSGTVTDIELEELISFYTRPTGLLLKDRLGIQDATGHFRKLYDEENLYSNTMGNPFVNDLFLHGSDLAAQEVVAHTAIELGKVPELSLANEFIGKIIGYHEKRNLIMYENACREFNCYTDQTHDTPLRMSEACRKYAEEPIHVEQTLEFDVSDSEVRLHCQLQTVELETSHGPARFVINDTAETVSAWIRHLAVNALEGGGDVASLMLNLDKANDNIFLPVAKEDAREKLAGLIAKACSPLPSDIPDFAKLDNDGDSLPNDYKQLAKFPRNFRGRTYNEKYGG